MKLKPYAEYKDSSVPWLDCLPSSWETRRAKTLFQIVDIRSETGQEELLTVSSKNGVIPRRNATVTMFKAESYVGYKLCWPGDLVINSLWAWMQGLGFACYNGIISSAYGVYRLNGDYSENFLFFDYLLRSYAYLWELRVRSKGIWRSRYQLTDDSFLDMPILIPPKEDQRQIIAYLDSESRKISRLIRNKRRLIELLKEQKQAIINQAVTHGIDPNVRLKPSGVEWLGDIPEHWEVRRLRTIASVKPSGVDKNSIENEQPVLLCNYVDVYKNEVITNKIDFMKATATQDEIRAFELKAGDVVITKDSESWDDIAVPAFVPETLPGVVCAYHLAIVRPNTKLIDGEFLFRAFSSDPVADQFRVSANGVTRYGLAQGAIKSAYFPFPPKEEQRKIIEFISEKSSEIHAAITRAEREIELMREYRTRLIADVVTGKVDVGDVPVEAFPQDWEEFEESAEPEEELEESLGAEEAEDADE